VSACHINYHVRETDEYKVRLLLGGNTPSLQITGTWPEAELTIYFKNKDHLRSFITTIERELDA